MDNRFTNILVAFNHAASRQVGNYYEKFIHETGGIDRKKDENVYRKTEGKYLYALKHQLEDEAMNLVEKNRHIPDYDRLRKILTDAIQGYLSEFKRKCNIL